METIIIMGSRGYSKNYGGWETFVRNLVSNWPDQSTNFVVFEMSDDGGEPVKYNDRVISPQIKTPKIGPFSILFYSIKCFFESLRMVNNMETDIRIFYVLGVRIGLLFRLYHRYLERKGIRVVINPDGLEWKRDKWNSVVKLYLKNSERHMIKASDHIICDSQNIKYYIDQKYRVSDKSSFVPYGSYIENDVAFIKSESTLKRYDLQKNDYYLLVGRLVPENKHQLIIESFMRSNTEKKLIIVSNGMESSFYKKLKRITGYKRDNRIQFIGPVYEKEVLFALRVNAFAYIHGHSAGGTNPSLLEAMSTTGICLCFDVSYNREVVGDFGFFFSKMKPLEELLSVLESLDSNVLKNIKDETKLRIKKQYNWVDVAKKTSQIFIELKEKVL